jgi:hypothetical protein
MPSYDKNSLASVKNSLNSNNITIILVYHLKYNITYVEYII